MIRSYAGIGSRQTPQPVLNVMRNLAKVLAREGIILYTGAAKGADQAFAEGAVEAGGNVVLCLPWAGYEEEWLNNLRKHAKITGAKIAVKIYNPFEDIAAKQSVYDYHPAPDRLRRGAFKLHARNYLIVDKVDIVVCWTPNGSGSGGTGQAIRIAKSRALPIMDLGEML